MFVAIMPPEHVIEDLDAFLVPRREHGWFRWSLAEQFHVTLAFLEQVPDHALDELSDGLERAAGRRPVFEAAICGGGAFPNPAHAKLLYCGLDLTFDARTELDRLATGTRAAAGRSGIAVDGARFRPHVTLARLRKPTEVTRWIRVLDSYAGPSWTVDRIALVASYLGEGTGRRPRYETVAQFSIGPSGDERT